MSDDERVANLSKRIEVSLEYTDTLKDKEQKKTKSDKTKLHALAEKIRKEFEEQPIETSAHPNART